MAPKTDKDKTQRGDYYADAGKCIEKVLAKKGTPKSVVFELKKTSATKLIYKIVIETLKFKPVLDQLIGKTQIQKNEKWIGKGRCLALVYDLLIGNGVKHKKYASCLAKYKSQLNNGFTLLKVKRKAKTALDLLPDEVKVVLPKYARINTLMTGVDECLEKLTSDGYQIERVKDGAEFIEAVRFEGKSEKTIIADPVLANVLAFHPQTNMAELSLTKENKLVLQDRASCLPPCILDIKKSDIVLDCCAAPGNKTHQLAERGKSVLACEADPQRFKLLSNRMKLLGADNVTPKLQNFFHIDVESKPWCDVTKIMLDPSCSGSGMSHRRILQETDSDERIEKLAQFQEKAIQKAMTFPKAIEISYSTCSVHKRENEQVVENVLKETQEWKQSNAAARLASFVPKKTDEKETLSLSVEPIKAATNGFFVALFGRS